MGTRSADDFYTGTRAALAGGTTTIMNFVIEARSMSLVDAYNLNKSRAEKKACCDFAFHSCVYEYNDKVAKEMEVRVFYFVLFEYKFENFSNPYFLLFIIKIDIV